MSPFPYHELMMISLAQTTASLQVTRSLALPRARDLIPDDDYVFLVCVLFDSGLCLFVHLIRRSDLHFRTGLG